MVVRENWHSHIDAIIRSRHYTWIGEQLAGEPPEEALPRMVADIMHICSRMDMPWQDIVDRGVEQFEREEIELVC